jgi:hypothetical protein
VVLDRRSGLSTDPSHLIKRQLLGSRPWEGLVVLEDGTVYLSDERGPSDGHAGGGIYKFVPAEPHRKDPLWVANPNRSPLAEGTLYGMRLGVKLRPMTDEEDYGQGREIGKGVWMLIEPQLYRDRYSNIDLSRAQLALGLTGYYRPEDMDQDPITAANGKTRICWANTGRVSHAGTSAIENAAHYGEVLCLVDEVVSTLPSGASPWVTRFLIGDPEANHFDNVAFQPKTGNLAVVEDSPVHALNGDGSLKELRGKDVWFCLPDGADRDLLTYGCIRIASVKDTDAEPTGLIFDASSSPLI